MAKSFKKVKVMVWWPVTATECKVEEILVSEDIKEENFIEDNVEEILEQAIGDSLSMCNITRKDIDLDYAGVRLIDPNEDIDDLVEFCEDNHNEIEKVKSQKP